MATQRYIGLNDLKDKNQVKLKESILPKIIDVFFTIKELNTQENEKSPMLYNAFLMIKFLILLTNIKKLQIFIHQIYNLVLMVLNKKKI